MTDEVSKKMYATIKALFNNAEERRSSEPKYLDISLTELDDGLMVWMRHRSGHDRPRYMFTMNVTTIVWDKI